MKRLAEMGRTGVWRRLGEGNEFPDALSAAAYGISIAYRGYLQAKGWQNEQVELTLESHFNPSACMPGEPAWRLKVSSIVKL